MKKILIVTTIFVAAIVLGYGLKNTFGNTATLTVDNIPNLKDWPEASQNAARNMEEKYGNPDEVTDNMLIWNENGVWLRTVVYKVEVPHDFPKPHTDVIEQWVKFRTPVDKFNELAMYDGSITANRTNGTLSSRCDMESMNFLALNLAHDVIRGDKSAEQARLEHGRQALSYIRKEKPEYTQTLNFANDQFAPDADKTLDIMKELIGTK